MTSGHERRDRERIRFSWPFWFGYEGYGEFNRGQIIDLNGSHVSFTTEKHLCPAVGCNLMVRFSYPLNQRNSFEMGSYAHWAEVVRIDSVQSHSQRVTMRLHRPITLDQPQPQTKQEKQLAQTA